MSIINLTNNDVKWSVMEPDLRMREFSYAYTCPTCWDHLPSAWRLELPSWWLPYASSETVLPNDIVIKNSRFPASNAKKRSAGDEGMKGWPTRRWCSRIVDLQWCTIILITNTQNSWAAQSGCPAVILNAGVKLWSSITYIEVGNYSVK